MGVRLNKVIRELNIGLQTAVGFLEKKPELGEVKSEPSFKITDEQYQALVEEYKGDKAAKDQAGQLKKPKEKKPRPAEPVDHKAETLLKDTRQKFTPLGKIDLDDANKRGMSSTPKQEPTPAAAAESPKVEETVDTPAAVEPAAPVGEAAAAAAVSATPAEEAAEAPSVVEAVPLCEPVPLPVCPELHPVNIRPAHRHPARMVHRNLRPCFS